MIKELLSVVVGSTLDRIGSFKVEEGSVGSATKYGRYDRRTGNKIGEELFIIHDGFAVQSFFYRSSSLRQKLLE